MIRVENVSKYFGQHKVLDNINTVFEEGKCNLIIGKSGSGKTVLMKCLVGLIYPDEGYIHFDNRILRQLSKKEKVNLRKDIGMLFQGGALFDSMNVEENVMFPIRMFQKSDYKTMRARVDFCLERVNLSGINKLFPSELSGGMQKRVAIARAIAAQPRYLFCDEPNSGLDPQTSIVIDKLIQEITKEYKMTANATNALGSAFGFRIPDENDLRTALFELGKSTFNAIQNMSSDERQKSKQAGVSINEFGRLMLDIGGSTGRQWKKQFEK